MEETSITNFDYEIFGRIVNKMPFWIPGKQYGVLGNSLIELTLELKKRVFTDSHSCPKTLYKPPSLRKHPPHKRKPANDTISVA
ncbi:hypothetical protein ACFLSA_00480 [Bacteroidota bacterium]